MENYKLSLGSSKRVTSYPFLLDHLSFILQELYNESGAIKHLNDAIVYGRIAVELLSSSEPQFVEYLHTLGTAFAIKRQKTQFFDDRDQAIRWCTTAVHADPLHGPFHHELALALRFKYERRDFFEIWQTDSGYCTSFLTTFKFTVPM